MQGNQESLISVIVPVYNVEMYLRECLDSLLAQTYKELEVVMVDDGSKDSSGSICDEYARMYDNFFVVHKENAGLGMARNTGLEHITGEYVTFLDSDDYLEPGCIEILYQNLVGSKVDMCKGGFQRFTDYRSVTAVREYGNEVFEGEKAKKELLPRMIGSSPYRHDSIEMCVCGAIYRTSPIKKHGLRFPSERELISEDLVFNIDYMQYADGACTISDVGYHYRENEKSLTASYRADRFEASRYFYLEMRKKLGALGYDQITFFRLDRMFFIYVRMCIAQEKRENIPKRLNREHIENIKRICEDKIVQKVIREYPKGKLGIKQRTFLKMIELKLAIVLFMLAELGKM